MVYKVRNNIWTFFAMRNIENEFVDFKGYNINAQIKEVYGDLSVAYKRGDRVTLNRSLSTSMFSHTDSILKAKTANPFLKQVDGLTLLQARVYAESDHLLPEEQWAQLTLRMKGTDINGQSQTQYNVFERRLADKMSYDEWRLSFQALEDEFVFLHNKD
jgi:hypothetical protein